MHLFLCFWSILLRTFVLILCQKISLHTFSLSPSTLCSSRGQNVTSGGHLTRGRNTSDSSPLHLRADTETPTIMRTPPHIHTAERPRNTSLHPSTWRKHTVTLVLVPGCPPVFSEFINVFMLLLGLFGHFCEYIHTVYFVCMLRKAEPIEGLKIKAI